MIVRNGKQTETGYVVVTVAAMLFILVGFTALAIDTGLLYADRTQAQRAADAAALAGAFTFVVDPPTGQPTTAQNHAIQTAVNNKVMGVAIDSSQVAVVVDVANRQVKVTITRSEPTFFAKVLGSAFMNVTSRVEAVAEAATVPTGAQCLKPFFIPNNSFAVPPLSAPCDACTQTQYLLADMTTHEKTAWAQSLINAGTEFVLKPQDPHDALAPSQFYMLDMVSNTGKSGKSGYQENIETCLTSTSVCQDNYDVITGNTVGPTRAGTKNLIGDPPRDTFVAADRYRYPDSTIHDTSKALVTAPIWDACNTMLPGSPPTPFCPAGVFPSGQGSSTPSLKIVAFALLFISSVDNQEGVHAHLVDILPCGAGTGDVDGSSAFSLPIRLVRLPQ